MQHMDKVSSLLLNLVCSTVQVLLYAKCKHAGPEGMKQSNSPSRGSTVDKKRKFVEPTEHVFTEYPCFRAKYRPSTPHMLVRLHHD